VVYYFMCLLCYTLFLYTMPAMLLSVPPLTPPDTIPFCWSLPLPLPTCEQPICCACLGARLGWAFLNMPSSLPSSVTLGGTWPHAFSCCCLYPPAAMGFLEFSACAFCLHLELYCCSVFLLPFSCSSSPYALHAFCLPGVTGWSVYLLHGR
jgi:hypothetical protein